MHSQRVSEAKKIPEKLGTVYRTAHVTRAALPEGSDPNRFAFSISSEEPADQWFGTEVLVHSAKSMRTDRLEQGVAALFNHCPNMHLGRTDKFSIKDKRLLVEGFFGPSPLAQEKRADYEAGTLVDVSIGYLIHHITRDQVGEYPSDDDTLMVDDWEPIEVSLVTIPADPSVGKGRAVDAQEIPVVVDVHRRQIVDVPTAAPAAIPTVIEVRSMADDVKVPDAGQIEIARRDRIMALGTDKDFSKHVSSGEIRAAFESGESAEVFSEKLSRKIIAANDASTVGTAGTRVVADLGKDAQRYSAARAFRAAINARTGGTFASEDYTLEREVSAEIAKRAGLSTTNMVVPNAIVSRMPSTRELTQTATGAGLTPQTALLNQVTESDLIQMFRNRARVLALGATRLGGLSGVVRLPRQDTAGTAQWLTETATTTASDLTTDFVALSPKRLSMQNIYTIELLAQSAVDVEGMLARDRAKVINLAIDIAAISGTGAGGQPLGILNASGLATIASTGATLTTGKALSYADTLKFESLIAAANADSSTMGWMATPEVRAQLKATAKFANAIASAIWESGTRDPDGIEVGPESYKAGVTNQLPKNLGAGLNLHALLFGDFSNILVADWGASELIVDPYTQAGAGAFVVTERSLMDVEFRHVTPFAVCETVAII